MESINQDLQASYNVIKLLEGSNINSERVFQSLPGVFAVINAKDEVLRGNKTLADHFNVDLDEILRLPFSNLFTTEAWNVFSDHLNRLRNNDPADEYIDFELGINDPDMISGEKAYYWHLRKMNVASQTEGELTIIIGEDISKLRESERKLHEIFSSIPLGIFTVNSKAEIEEFQSSYLEYLLGPQDFTGKTMQEVLFEPAMESMSEKEKEGVVSLDFVLGQGSTTYDMLEGFFPKQIFYPDPELNDGGRWLKVIYQPVVYDETVKRLMIILEDRTEIIKTREIKKKAKLLEDQSVQRVFQLRQADNKGLHLYMKELNSLIMRLYEEEKKNADLKQLFATVHGIKGIARVAGFTFLKEAANQAEEEFQKSDTRISEEGKKKLEKLYSEFSALFSLYKAVYPESAIINSFAEAGGEKPSGKDQISWLFNQYNALLRAPNSLNKTFKIDQLFWGLLSYHYSFAESLEEGLTAQAGTTAAALRKKVKVHFDWGNVLIKTSVLSALNESLIHLINNAIDHGIEFPEEREKQNKEAYGNIYILLSEKDSVLTCEVTDDGAGIDSVVIRETAAGKSIKSTVELSEMDDEEVLQLIFHPGFTTAEDVSETSGRGIGMEAVMSNLERFRGAIHIDSKKGRGTTFQLSMQLIGRDDLQLVKRCYPLAYFKNVIVEYIDTIIKDNSFTIDVSFGDGFEKGIFYGDLVKAIICFSSYIGHYATKGHLKVNWSLVGDYYIKCSVCLKEANSEATINQNTVIQFFAPMQLCKYFILKDNGKITETDESFEIELPCYFHAKGAPNLVVGYTPKVETAQAKTTFRKIREVARELDVNVTFSGDKEKVNMLIYPSYTKSRNKILSPYPGFTVSSSRKMIQQDILKGIERLMTLRRRKQQK